MACFNININTQLAGTASYSQPVPASLTNDPLTLPSFSLLATSYSKPVADLPTNNPLNIPSLSLLAKPTNDAYSVFLKAYKLKYNIHTKDIEADDLSDERLAEFIMSYHLAEYAPRIYICFC